MSDLERDDPKAAAEYYRRHRLAGTWAPEYGSYLYKLQSTPEQLEELAALLAEVARELAREKPIA